MNNFGSLDVFGIEAKRNSDSEYEESKLISIATKDVCDNDIVSDLLSCKARGNDLVKSFTKERLEEKSTDFFAPIKRNKPKTFAPLYKSSTTESTKRSKVRKADRKILQQV